MTLLEALATVQLLREQSSPVRHQLIKNIVSYFFINPARLSSCPFLVGQDCRIYNNRFFGCRTYGLWSQKYYNSLADHSRETKKAVQQQWRELGIKLPQQVIDFQLPYCGHVKTVGDNTVDDEGLSRLADAIETLSGQFADRHQEFNQNYFADLSFLTTSLIFGVTGAIQIKFTVVRDLVTTGNQTRLKKILGELPDPFTEAA
jgi:Fe-S-cluster containining protein